MKKLKEDLKNISPKAKVRQPLTPAAELALIQSKLRHPTKEEIAYWLDTGDKRLNAVLGSEVNGLPYGKLTEVAGWESHGKTALMYGIAGMAQKDGASVGIWDLEGSWDDTWAVARGLDPTKVIVFKPIIGIFGNEKKKRPITAEEQCEEVELWMDRCNERNPSGRIFLGIDSVAAMVTEEEEGHGISDQNMRTKVSVASFLTFLLKRWTKRAANYNAMIYLVNQIRMAPGKYGNPEYSPGGNAIRFYCSVRVKVRRKGGKILKEGQVQGFKGVIHNWKNKAGAESKEGARIGFKLYYNGKIKYVPVEEIKPDKGALDGASDS